MIIDILHNNHTFTYFRKNNGMECDGTDKSDGEERETICITNGILIIFILVEFDSQGHQHCVRDKED